MIDKDTQVVFSPRIIIYRNYNPQHKRLFLSQLNKHSPDQSIHLDSPPPYNQKSEISDRKLVKKDSQKEIPVDTRAYTSRNYMRNFHPLNMSVVNLNNALAQGESFRQRVLLKPEKPKLVRNIHTAISKSRFKKVSEAPLYKNRIIHKQN